MFSKDILLAIFDDEIAQMQTKPQKEKGHTIESTLSFSGGGGGGGGGGGSR